MYKPIVINDLGINKWYVFSKKLNREVRLYGQLEYDHWFLIETDPQVINYCEKPIEINHSYFGKPDKALIDMWIKRRNVEEYVSIARSNQITPEKESFSISMFERINSAKIWAQSNNYKHIVTTENYIYSNLILLENKKLLLPYNNDIALINRDLQDRIINKIKEGIHNITDIRNNLFGLINIYDFQKTLYSLILQEIVVSNIDQVPLGPETEVYLR